MAKEIFKVGDRVYHIDNGWGVIDYISDSTNDLHPIQVVFEKVEDDTKYFTIDGRYYDWSEYKSLSFTEYTLQGFSQERPIELPEVGELCLVRDYEDDTWLVREFAEYRHGLFICQAVQGEGEVEWKYMKRIKILD